MNVKDFLIAHPENNDLPLILIDQAGIVRKFDSCLSYLSRDRLTGKYINGCAQLDLDGESTFIIVYCTFDV